jgi:hypothetical protein
VTGSLAGGVYKVVVGRTTAMHGQEMGAAMGVNTWAAFAGSDERAVVDGDVAMQEGELQGVLRALRRADIDVVAIHHHMTGEEPRILFLHYWGVGRTDDLARGLRAALDVTARGPAPRPGRPSSSCANTGASRAWSRRSGSTAWRAGAAWRRARSRAGSRRMPRCRPVIADACGRRVRRGRLPAARPQRGRCGGCRARGRDRVDLGAAPAAAGAPVEKWDGIPPATEGYAASRDVIKARVEALIESLAPARR